MDMNTVVCTLRTLFEGAEGREAVKYPTPLAAWNARSAKWPDRYPMATGREVGVIQTTRNAVARCGGLEECAAMFDQWLVEGNGLNRAYLTALKAFVEDYDREANK